MTVARTAVRVKGTRQYVQHYGPGAHMGKAYDAAQHGRRNRTWLAPEIGPNQAIAFNLTTLRNRSRDQVRQNAYASRASDAFVSNLIGTGIKPLPKVQSPAFRDRLQRTWNTWVTEADAAGELDFYGLQAQIIRSWFEGGECFVRRRIRLPQDGLTTPVQLQVLESEHLPVEKNEIEPSTGNVIRHGIEFDAIGRRVAYHMYQTHPGDRDGLEMLSRRGVATPDLTTRIPASEILHVFLPTRPGQKRGEPALTQALLTLRDLDQWNDAELLRQKMGAMFLGVIKRVQDEGPVVGEQDTEATADEESPAAEVQTLEPGTFTELDEGEDVSWSDPPEVGDNYETFLRNRLRAVAQSVGVLYEQLTGDYSQINDRTYRAARNEVLRQVEMLQQNVVIPQLCRPVWRWFYTIARETTLSKPMNVAEQDAQRVVWVPQGHRHIHPLQDAQAERSLIRAGLKSRSAAALERGESAEEVDLEVSRDNARADSLGLVFDTDPRHVTQQGAAHGADPGFEDGDGSGTPNGNGSE